MHYEGISDFNTALDSIRMNRPSIGPSLAVLVSAKKLLGVFPYDAVCLIPQGMKSLNGCKINEQHTHIQTLIAHARIFAFSARKQHPKARNRLYLHHNIKSARNNIESGRTMTENLRNPNECMTLPFGFNVG